MRQPMLGGANNSINKITILLWCIDIRVTGAKIWVDIDILLPQSRKHVAIW